MGSHTCEDLFPLFLFQLHQNASVPHLTGKGLTDPVEIGVGDDHRCDDFVACLRNGVPVEFDQRLTGSDTLPGSYQRAEMSAFQLYGVNTDVHQKLRTEIRGHHDSMAGVGNGIDRTVCRSFQKTAVGQNGKTVSENFIGKSGIRNLFDGNGASGERGEQGLKRLGGGFGFLSVEKTEHDLLHDMWDLFQYSRIRQGLFKNRRTIKNQLRIVPFVTRQ